MTKTIKAIIFRFKNDLSIESELTFGLEKIILLILLYLMINAKTQASPWSAGYYFSQIYMKIIYQLLEYLLAVALFYL